MGAPDADVDARQRGSRALPAVFSVLARCQEFVSDEARGLQKPGMKPRAHVLVVDDSADTRETLRVLLELEGYAVSVARHGREALEIQGRTPADVVVTDVYMPEQDGIETMHALRVRFPCVKVIVMSGTARMEAVGVVARELGVSAVLQKPVEPSELIKVIEEMVRDRDD